MCRPSSDIGESKQRNHFFAAHTIVIIVEQIDILTFNRRRPRAPSRVHRREKVPRLKGTRRTNTNANMIGVIRIRVSNFQSVDYKKTIIADANISWVVIVVLSHISSIFV